MTLPLPQVGCIPWRMRSDIEWQNMGNSPEAQWLAHDPMTRHLYRFGEPEKAILHRLDGRITLSQLKAWFTEHFSPIRIDDGELVQLIQTSAQRGLLRYDGLNPILEGSNKATNFWGWMAALPWKLLSSRFSLGNPDAWLRPIAPLFGWLFSTLAVRFWFLITLVVMIALMASWDRVWHSLPSWDAWFSPGLWFGLGTAFVLTRCFHELGHAIVCVRHGAKCVDFGWMLMMGVACPYVDVTDAWRLRDWRHRASIAAAGVYAELVLASLAGAYWLSTDEGPLHQLAWQVMLVSAISILFFNANPLMRYDGYYLLCDWIQQPNLRDHADREFRNWLWNSAFGTQVTSGAMGCALSRQRLILFGMCTALYRLLFVVGIIICILATAAHWQMLSLGMVLAGLVLVSGFLIPIGLAVKDSFLASMRGQQSRMRTGLVWSGLAGSVWLLLVVPFPQRLASRGVLENRALQPVRSMAAGFLNVQEEDIDGVLYRVIELHYPAQQAKYLQLQQQLAEVDRQRQLFESSFIHAPEGSQEPSMVMQDRQWIVQQLQALDAKRSVSRLTIPFGERWEWGVPPPSIVSSAHSVDPSVAGDVAPIGTGAEGQYVERWIPAGTLLGWREKGRQWVVRCWIDDQKAQNLRQGDPVQVRLMQRPFEILEGVVRSLQSSRDESASSVGPKPAGWLEVQLQASLPDTIHPGAAEIVVKTQSKSLWRSACDWYACQ